MPQSRESDLHAYVDRPRHCIVNFSWLPRGLYDTRCVIPTGNLQQFQYQYVLMVPCFGATSLIIPLVILLIVSLLHNVAFNTGTFYLALYYQVRARLLSSDCWDIFPYRRPSTLPSQIFALELCSFLIPWGHPWHRCLLLGS